MKYFAIIMMAAFVGTIMSGSALADDYEPQETCSDCPQYKITVTQNAETLGSIILETFPHIAPKHARNFDSLVTIGFYDGTAFHRVIPGFMIQGGDPNSKNKPEDKWGMGDPSQRKIPAEFSDIHHGRGILSAARSRNPNSATSQFFIMVDDASHLNNQYSVYGQVVEGMKVVDQIVNSPRNAKNRPLQKIEMKIEKIEE